MKGFDNQSSGDRLNGKVLVPVIFCCVLILVAMLILVVSFVHRSSNSDLLIRTEERTTDSTSKTEWILPDSGSLGYSKSDQLIRYGRDLIANTSYYLGPEGIVGPISNGMNCQNCHLNAGTKIFGNNYSAVASTYPKFRNRSGTVEGIYKRVNDCIQRSLNGSPLDSASREMQAIKAYMIWLGKNVKRGEKPYGVGIKPLDYLDRPADPVAGEIVFMEKCALCHGENGQGKKNIDTASYPPLWGPDSYNIGAGLYRLSRFAGYVKSNMPFGTSYDKPQLSDEEAWDVAAYVNSQPRPIIDLSNDWPDIGAKPIDHPFGPYKDEFSERQHKYGPFGPIETRKKKQE